MENKRNYIIPFGSLKDGEHEFEYQINRSFFESFENAEITDSDVSVVVILKKKTTLLEFQFDIEGKITVPCDRCLEDTEIEIENIADLYVRFGEENLEESDESIVISSKEYELDISQYIYEYIVLAKPFRCVHPEDKKGNSTCNPEMISRISQFLPDEIDPRWNDLKKLSDNK